MEIHPPHSAPHSLREILLQLAIVTVGILIALSLEGTLTWWEHRVLVREARERIHAELRGDQGSIHDVLKASDEGLKRFQKAIGFADSLSHPDGGGAEGRAVCAQGNGNLLYGTSFAWLNTSSFAAAQSNGALGLMGYDESVRYADAYDLQNIYVRMQDAAEKDAFAAALLCEGLLAKPAPAEILEAKRQLRIALGDFIIVRNIAQKLDELYSRALKD